MESFVNVCHYLLDNGQRCRCYPNRNSDYCRHHLPSRIRSHPRGQQALPETEPRPMTRAEMSIGWRGYHAWIRQTEDPSDFPEVIELILGALGDRNISPRSAGRLLQDIEDRRRQLEPPQTLRQALLEQVEALKNRVNPAKNGGAPC